MGKKVEYKQELKAVCDDDATFDVTDEKVPLGYKRTIQHVSVENETSDAGAFRIGYLKNDTYHWWVEETDPVVDRLYWMRDSRVLPEDTQLVVRFTEAEEDDVIHVHIDGFTEKVGGG